MQNFIIILLLITIPLTTITIIITLAVINLQKEQLQIEQSICKQQDSYLTNNQDPTKLKCYNTKTKEHTIITRQGEIISKWTN